MTLRGLDCLRKAEVVLYDKLVNPFLLGLAPESADKTLVGKSQGRATVDQKEIESMLVEYAQAGRRVVRLKGGDPFIFGRGGEEAEACRAAGVDFEVVPGVTSAIAAPAYAGIPLSHREHSSIITFVTGRPSGGRELDREDFAALARSRGTLVFLMAMTRMTDITAGLLQAGLATSTPAAAVRWGTTPRQVTVAGDLGDVAAKASAQGLRPPVVLVVGAVAALAAQLDWYARLPLFGRRIVVTRAAHQAGELRERLEYLGAEVLEFPTIEIIDPAEPAAVEKAYSALAVYDWLVVSSRNGARRFLDGLLASGRDIRELAGVKIAAVGPATAAVVEHKGLRVAARPVEYRAEALAEAMGDVDGTKVLVAGAQAARDVLPLRLRQKGAHVDVVSVYRTVMPRSKGNVGDLENADMITFASASSVRNFISMAGDCAQGLLDSMYTVAIGPVTASCLEEMGLEPDLVAQEYTVAGMVEAITEFFANKGTVQ